ncbi:hypothetical protein Tco_0502456 [Tanacetum coccineum]
MTMYVVVHELVVGECHEPNSERSDYAWKHGECAGTVHRVLFISGKKLQFFRITVHGMGSDRDAENALSKLLQMGTVAEYESKFVILANRVTGIYANLLKSFYISGLTPALQCALLMLNPTTLDEAFSLARVTEARFTNLQLLKLLRSNPTTLGEAFFRALITETHFENENNQAVDNNVGDQEDSNMNDKQEVKKADDQEVENVKDEEGKNVKDQQVSKADDDANNNDFGCSLPPYKGVDLTVEEVIFENTKSDLKKDKDEQGLSKEPYCKSNLDVHLKFHVDRQDIGVESVTPVLQEDGRPKRPQREKSKPEWHIDYVI